MLLNVGCILLVGCGGQDATPDADNTLDPQSVNDANAGESQLSAEERNLLARAKGRDWEMLGAHDLQAYLQPQADSTTAVFLWLPNTGASRLAEVQAATRGLDTLGVRVAVAVMEGGDDRAELIALRESKIVLPAFRLARSGDYTFISRGLPVGNTLITSAAGATEITSLSQRTPVTAFKPLLTAMAPK